MAKRVYIETTIPSFYFDARSDAEMVARRGWTTRWWQAAADRYEIVTSVAVVEELTRGDFPARDDCLRLIERLPLVPIEHHRCDFLLTWNCRHLANANKFDHIRRVNGELGLFVPALVTPLELLGDDDDDEH